MSRFASAIAYLGTFAVARGTLFLAPLGLANLLPASDYAQVEWAYATGTILATLLTFGTASLVPVVTLGKSLPPNASIEGVRLHHFGIAMLCICTALAGLGVEPVRQVALMCGAVALQGLLSTELKTQGRPNASLLVDACLFSSMAMGSLIAHWLAPDRMDPGAWIPVMVVLLWLTWRLGADVLACDWRASQWHGSIIAGLPLMLTGIVATLLTSSGRAGAGYFIGDQGAALYAVLSRGAALPIVAHQVILVARFKAVFETDEKRLTSVLTGILALVVFSAIAFWSLRSMLSPLLGPAFAQACTEHPSALGWLLGQSVLWSAIALNDLANTRLRIAAPVLRTSIPALVVALTIASLVIMTLPSTPEWFVRVHGMAMLFFYCAQSLTMWKLGARLPRLWCFVIACYLLICGLTT